MSTLAPGSSAVQASARVPFCRPTITTAGTEAVARALAAGGLAGGGAHTAACHARIRQSVPGTPFLTTSCTDALEMAALVIGLAPGDEVVMPSWTFPSTANAVALRGAIPVFVDVDPATLNLDPVAAAAALTPRTRAIVCVHYAGVGCDMDALRDLCTEAGLALVEDAAQAFGARWNGAALGGIGDLGAFSFHATKNVSSGEGGALMVGRPDLVARAETAWEKGTDRLRYHRGEVGRYEWCDLGSSFLPSEMTAALLTAQIASTEWITDARRAAWARYADLFAQAASPALRLPEVPPQAWHNGHIFALRFRSARVRHAVLAVLDARGIEARTHYLPLHSAPAGRRFGRAVGTLPVTRAAAETLLRMPIDAVITPAEQERVVAAVLAGLAAAGEPVAG